MPQTRLDLESNSSTSGQGARRGITPKRQNPNSVVNASSGSNISGSPKLIFRKEHKMTDFIEADYNPTTFPIKYAAKYNSKSIIGGDDAIEWEGISKREFNIELMFNDFGHPKAKGFKDSADFKLDWLTKCITQPVLQIIEDKAMTLPPVVFVEMGSRAFRAVITKLSGKEIMQDKSTFDPIRLKVNVTVRVIRRKRGTKPPS